MASETNKHTTKAAAAFNWIKATRQTERGMHKIKRKREREKRKREHGISTHLLAGKISS